MFQKTDDLRIRQVRPLIPPAILHEEIPISERASNVVAASRAAIANALKGQDPRLVVIAGPCSIHDTAAALEYGEQLARLASRYADHLIVVMRTYFEKPRTSVGWKGLINDPDLDESFHINKGLRLARKLLLDINDLGLPTASEFLDIQIPQHIADLTSWVAIGARTTESQVHRELASGLSMPVGFKNSTDGSVNTAIDAVLAARSAHWFPSVTKQGVSAIFQTSGNDACHVILRGGKHSGPNFDATHVGDVSARLAKQGLAERVMVDCSHGNSEKDHRRQPARRRIDLRTDSRRIRPDLRRDAGEPPGRRPSGLRAWAPRGLRAEHHGCVHLARRDRGRAGAARAGAASPRRARQSLIALVSRVVNTSGRSSQTAGPTKQMPLPSASRTMKSRPPHACFLSFWSNVAPAATYSA